MALVVLAGCRSVDFVSLGAELTGGDDTACAAAVYFLATFRVPAEDVGDATLGG